MAETATHVDLVVLPEPDLAEIAPSNELLEAALSYADRGWCVFPLYEPEPNGGCSCGKPTCDSPGKHPRTPHGSKDATTDPPRIATWWNTWPNANVGIATGRASNLVVLDVDRAETLGGWQPETLSANTGRGMHFYFLDEGRSLKNSVAKLGPGLDVRGEGGFVVAPPSRHENGSGYQWLDPGQELSPAPLWLVQGRPIPRGQRNDGLFKIGAAMQGRGADERTILEELRRENDERCVPPLPGMEVEKIAGSVSRYEQKSGISGMPIAALLARERVEPDWIIPGLLKRQNTMFVVGEPKRACKSWLLANLAWDLSEGRSVWGVQNSKKGPLFVPKTPMRVVYFSQEDAEDDFQDRAELLKRSGRIPNERFWFVPKNLQMMVDSEEAVSLFEQELDAAAKPLGGLDLVILDPLRRIMQGNENDSEAIARIWKRLDDWGKRWNCAFTIAHHVVKPPRVAGTHHDPTSPYASRGSGDIYGGADAFINVVPANEKGQRRNSRLLGLHFTTKRSRELSPIKIRINFETGRAEFEGFLVGRAGDDGEES